MRSSQREFKSLRIAVSGASGFIGSVLVLELEKMGHKVTPIVREKDRPNTIYWNPEFDIIEAQALENFDVIINLAGKSVADKRWSEKLKSEFKESRIRTTKLLANTISRLKKPPRLFLCASASGYYGDRGDEPLTESAEPGTSFLAQLAREWELATWEAEAIGVTVHSLRFGVVLSPAGGALKKMLLSARLGLSAVMGSGNQYMPWVAREDVIRAIVFLIENPQPSGPFNIVAPQPVTNTEFTRTLAKALHRPSFLKLPPSLVRFFLGEMADALLLDSARVIPEKLTKAGFEFSFKDLTSALQMLHGKSN
jgi:uncharacterized protein (TIGR01777 family)